MLKEMRAVEYALEILRAMHHNPGKHDSVTIYNLVQDSGRITVSKTYTQKILQRMRAAGLLTSNDGYNLVNPIDEITVDQVLEICDMPDVDSPLYSLCNGMKEGVSLTSVDEFYDFSR